MKLYNALRCDSKPGNEEDSVKIIISITRVDVTKKRYEKELRSL